MLWTYIFRPVRIGYLWTGTALPPKYINLSPAGLDVYKLATRPYKWYRWQRIERVILSLFLATKLRI